MYKLIEAIEILNIPVYLSGMSRGLMGKTHRLHFRHKRGIALKNADFVLLAGTSMDFRLDYGRGIASKAYFAMVNLGSQNFHFFFFIIFFRLFVCANVDLRCLRFFLFFCFLV